MLKTNLRVCKKCKLNFEKEKMIQINDGYNISIFYCEKCRPDKKSIVKSDTESIFSFISGPMPL